MERADELDPGSVFRIMMLWPLQKHGCERDTIGSSMLQVLDVLDMIQREARGGEVALLIGETVTAALRGHTGRFVC